VSAAYETKSRDRIGMAAAVAAVHVLLGLMLIRGIGFDVVRAAGEAMKVFDVSETEPPPEPPPKPKQTRAPARQAPLPSAQRSPAQAPKPIVPVPSAPIGSTIGTADQPGVVQGAGGRGEGAGAGGNGTGGGVATHARLIRRELRRSDYPREARRTGAEGTVTMRIEVAPDGRVSGCSVTRSSGSALLDETTCRLARKRFRYEPARDAAGRAVPDVVTDGQRWWIERDAG